MRLTLRAPTPWKPEDINELLLASDFEVGGLDTRNRRFGLGVPLIAVKRTDPKQVGGEGRFYPAQMAFPLTAILRPNTPLLDAGNARASAFRDCTIDLVDPVQLRTIGHGADTLSIEADLTTPLAYMWSRTDLNKYRWTGLLRPGQATDRAGLMLIRPYEPGKIPVVMVHGLWSSPLAWIPMLNELLREPDIQKHYQFMLYLYPTGMPVPIAASGLRDSLEEARTRFNPRGTDPAFGKMVLLGHSMGGLLSHAMVVADNELFWQMFTYKSFKDILGPPDLLREIDHYIHFQPLPYVRRVVFLATPHRGSDYARKLVGRVGTSLISEPDAYTKLIDRLVKDNPDTFPRRIRHLPTSIETLDPESPVLAALMKMPVSPGVVFHSIIGSIRPEARSDTTDGIVPYASAHLDGAESEVVVHSGHGIQKNPLAIREVKRILLKHLAEQLPPPTVPPAPRQAALPPAAGPASPAPLPPS
jgi:pimeloyl-ACP methyl ester carboxylesterase